MSKPSGNGPDEIDKKRLYGRFEKGERFMRRLALKAADMADDEMQVSVDKSSGVGAAGLIGVALAAGVPSALLGLALLFKGGTTSPVPLDPSPATQQTGGSIPVRVLWFDKDGNPIEGLKPISMKPISEKK